MKEASLSDVKSQFIRLVTELGALDRESQSLAREMNQTKQYLRGKENMYFPSVVIDRNDVRKEGVIYIQAKESDKVFQG